MSKPLTCVKRGDTMPGSGRFTLAKATKDYTVRELVERWKVSRQRVHQLLQQAGVQPRPSRFGRMVLVAESDVRRIERDRAA